MKIYNIEITIEDLMALLNLIKESTKRLKVPKNKKNTVGVVVAIRTENDKEKIRLENDLIAELNRYIKDSEIGNKFHVIKYPQNLVCKISDNKTAWEHLIRSRAHFILHGNITQRKIRGQNSYIFKLYGMVRHKPIPKIMQSQFSQEFSELLPSRISFPETEEALGFELTKQWIGYVVKYIIGIAAFVSGDINLSHKLYTDLEKEVNDIPQDEGIPVIYEIKRRLPYRLSEVLTIYLQANYSTYADTRDRKYIFDLKPILKKLQEIDSDNYHAHLIRAILYFFEGKVDSAIEGLRDLNHKDITWRYSLGFLYAYKGDIHNALESYKKTFHKSASSNVCIDSEIFISEAIKERPKKIQLNFFRGLLNYKIKQDYLLAKEDFKYFLDQQGSSKFPRLVELANKYLSEINRNLGE